MGSEMCIRDRLYNPVWECVVCNDEYNENEGHKPHMIKEHAYCLDCIKRLIDGAWENERSYGNTKVSQSAIMNAHHGETYSC